MPELNCWREQFSRRKASVFFSGILRMKQLSFWNENWDEKEEEEPDRKVPDDPNGTRSHLWNLMVQKS